MARLLALGLVLFPSLPHAGTPFEATALQVVALSPGHKAARGGIHRARLGEAVTLYAALEGVRDGRRVVITAAAALELGGQRVPPATLVLPGELPDARLRWYKVEPTGNSYNNTAGGFHWDEIAYREHPWGPWGARWQVTADAHPNGYPDTHGGAGTMAYKVIARLGARTLSSPGKESKFRGGLSGEVPRVAIRRDDTFIGRLTELFNTPYIWGSAGVPPREHQAERLIGSDCADFVVYGARRLGKDFPYRATWHLQQMATSVARAEQVDEKGRFLQTNGEPVPIGESGAQIGDLLLFPRHVGALAEDREPIGVLDNGDIMIHTFWAPPTEEPIKDTHYAESPVRVLRWK